LATGKFSGKNKKQDKFLLMEKFMVSNHGNFFFEKR